LEYAGELYQDDGHGYITDIDITTLKNAIELVLRAIRLNVFYVNFMDDLENMSEICSIPKLTIRTGTENDFFARGKELAKKLDQGENIEPECILSFEEGDLMTLTLNNVIKGLPHDQQQEIETQAARLIKDEMKLRDRCKTHIRD